LKKAGQTWAVRLHRFIHVLSEPKTVVPATKLPTKPENSQKLLTNTLSKLK